MRLPILLITIFLGSWGLSVNAKTSSKNKSQTTKVGAKSTNKSTKKTSAKSTAAPQSNSEEKPASSGLKKEFRFSALDVNGRYQTAGSMDTKVETEKVLTDILSLRTDFKDRVKAETKRR